MIRRLLGDSWRTSLAGIGAFAMVLGIMMGQATGTIDAEGNPIPEEEIVQPETVEESLGLINWHTALTGFGGVLTMFGFFSARDNKVSSEAAGVK